MPDAPPPTFDSHGNLVSNWRVVCEYDNVEDVIRVRWIQEAGPYHSAKSRDQTYPPQDIEDAVSDIQRSVRILAARRLF